MFLRDLLSTFCGQKLRCGRTYGRLPIVVFKFSSTVRKFQSLKEITNSWVRRLKQEDVPDPVTSVRFICENVLGKNSAYLTDLVIQGKDVMLTEESVSRINDLCFQRVKRVPVQYILGEWDFRHLTLLTRPPVFIPRPETEELVDLVARHHNLANEEEKFSFLDIGCGSGPICLSLLSEFPQASCVAIDKSQEAVNLTRDNAERVSVSGPNAKSEKRIGQMCVAKIALQLMDVWYSSMLNFVGSMKFDALISNPPYIPERDMVKLQPEISRFEDREALCGGADGLAVIKQILRVASSVLKPHGSVWLEVDTSHPRLIQPWISSRDLGLEYGNTLSDFTGRSRFCHIVLKE